MSSRRDLLKRALIVLGAGVLVQPNGGVSSAADEPPKERKAQGTLRSGSKANKPFNKTGAKAGGTMKFGAKAASGDNTSGNAKTPQ
jgi:hypothetical protein